MSGHEWMRSYCNLGREALRLPFSVELDGKSWDCATDGHAIVLVEGATFQKREAAPPADGLLKATKRTNTVYGVAPLVQLLDFAFAGLERCQLCFGAGIQRDEALGESACARCNGTGHKKYQPGFILGTCCNRSLLARLLLPFRTASLAVLVRVGTPREAIEIRDPDDKWRVYQMPLNPNDIDRSDHPVAPVTVQEEQP